MKINKRFVNVSISIPEEYYDPAYYAISNLKILGVEEQDDTLIISLDIINWDDSARISLLENLKLINNTIEIINEEIIDDQNWNAEFEKNSPVIIIDKNIGIAPEWKIDQLNTKHKIIINPKMSFGTGDHETTKMICKLIASIDLNNRSWIDAGCGSGILSILAMKLGASSVFAFDNDDWAIENSIENIRLNNLSDSIKVKLAFLENISLPPADGIMANMYANLLKSALDKFHDSLKISRGDLIISGILKYDSEDVKNEIEKYGFKLMNELRMNEWIALHYKLSGE